MNYPIEEIEVHDHRSGSNFKKVGYVIGDGPVHLFVCSSLADHVANTSMINKSDIMSRQVLTPATMINEGKVDSMSGYRYLVHEERICTGDQMMTNKGWVTIQRSSMKEYALGNHMYRRKIGEPV